MKIFIRIAIVFLIIYLLWFAYKRYIKMNISNNGIKFIKGLEGFRNKAYKDSKGLWTTGVGHLIKPNEQELITKVLTDQEVEDLLEKDLKEFEDAANAGIRVPVSQHEYDAIVSIAFNIGKEWVDGDGYRDSGFLADINWKKGKEKTLHDIMLFRHPPELLGRRAKEARLFDKGNYDWKYIASNEVDYYAKVNLA